MIVQKHWLSVRLLEWKLDFFSFTEIYFTICYFLFYLYSFPLKLLTALISELVEVCFHPTWLREKKKSVLHMKSLVITQVILWAMCVRNLINGFCWENFPLDFSTLLNSFLFDDAAICLSILLFVSQESVSVKMLAVIRKESSLAKMSYILCHTRCKVKMGVYLHKHNKWLYFVHYLFPLLNFSWFLFNHNKWNVIIL